MNPNRNQLMQEFSVCPAFPPNAYVRDHVLVTLVSGLLLPPDSALL